MHKWHPLHFSTSTLCGFFFSPSIAPNGQVLAHAVHPIHFSSSIVTLRLSDNSASITFFGQTSAHTLHPIHLE